MRVVRVNELLKREISQILHTRYKAEAVYITVSEVSVAPNLRAADVFYDVVGGENRVAEVRRFFGRERKEIQRQLGKNVVLKYMPQLQFKYDESLSRGTRLNQLMDELGLEGETEPPEEDQQ